MKQILYYGTDARFFKADEKIRQLYGDMCKVVIYELYPKFEPYYEPTKNNFVELFKEHNVSYEPAFLKDLADAMYSARMFKKYGQDNINTYKLYTTRLFAHSNAINAYAGGTLGKSAYILIKAAELLQWIDWDSSRGEIMMIVKGLVEMKHKPIVIIFSNISQELLDKKDSNDCLSDISLGKEEFQELLSKSSDYVTEDVDVDINKALRDEKNFIPYLYHGTDARIINMSNEERNQYIADCKLVVDYLWNLFKPLFSSYEMTQIIVEGKQATVNTRKIEKYKDLFVSQNLEILYNNLLEKLWMTETSKEGNQQYQYGGLYLTSSEITARHYAVNSFAGGEIGLTAHRFIEGAEIIKLKGLHSDKIINSAMERIEAFATDQASINPVVVKVRNIEPSYLLTDKGESIDWFSDLFFAQHFRYIKKDVRLDLDSSEYLKK